MNKLTQQNYKKIKLLNLKSVEIMQNFLILLNLTLYDFVTEPGGINNIGKINELKKIIDAQSCMNFKKIEKLIELGKIKYIDSTNSTCIRYYYEDAYRTITMPVTQQIQILKKFTKKMIKLIQFPTLRKEFENIRTKTIRDLKKLEKVQNEITAQQ